MRGAMSSAFGVAMACCLCSSIALAQVSGEPRRGDLVDAKDLGTALLLSSGATAGTYIVAAVAGESVDHPVDYAFVGLAAAGLVLGPTAGHWYLGRAVTPGLIIRLSGLAASAAGIALISWRGPEGEGAYGPIMLVALGGAGAWATGTIWDVATLPREVRRYNARHPRREIGLVPLTTAGSGTGLAVAGSF